MTHRPKTVVLAAPRGFCAGVHRAVRTVEQALERHGRPLYVLKQIVHNTRVVAELAAKGAVFVETVDAVPTGSTLVFSAHGVAPAVRRRAAERELTVVDATCPLVAKVHAETRRRTRGEGQVLLIGHAGHDEVEGTLGERPGRVRLIDRDTPLDSLDLPGSAPLTWLSQTTLPAEEIAEVASRLRKQFPGITGPDASDICYASQNRQDAVKALATRCDVVFVAGSPNSSNSRSMVEVALGHGAPAAYLVDSPGELRPDWVAQAATVGVTAGASAPETVVQDLLAWLDRHGFHHVEELVLKDESVDFRTPLDSEA